MTDSVFLHGLKLDHKVKIWDYDIEVVDFYTSQSCYLAQKDFNEDFSGARSLTPPPKVVLDLGANVGIFSVLMAKHYGATVYAVEAAPHNAENLAATIAKNGVEKLVTPLQACVAGAFGRRVLYQHPLNSGSCSIHNAPPYPAIDTPAMPLDELFAALSLPHVDFMKVDIEGSEFEVFETFTKWDKVSKVGIEIHGYADNPGLTDEKSEELYKLLASKLGAENVCAQLECGTYRYGVQTPRERWKPEA